VYQSVADAFPLRFSATLEGYTHNAYLDVKGLVTVGIGCLIDPVVMALSLPWVKPDGTPAPASLIESELESLKAQQGLKNYPAGSKQVLGATTIRLTDDGVASLCRSRMLANEVFLRRAFTQYDVWPADAQMFAHSMAWAIGAGWPGIFGHCTQLLRQTPPQFGLCAVGSAGARPEDASAPCDISTEGNAGIIPRNAQNRLMLVNAQLVQDRGLPTDVLYWPSSPIRDTEPSPPMAESDT
jgi:hypothetical protein